MRAIQFAFTIPVVALLMWLKGPSWHVAIGAMVATDLLLLITAVPAVFGESWVLAVLHVLATLVWVWAVFAFGPDVLFALGLPR